MRDAVHVSFSCDVSIGFVGRLYRPSVEDSGRTSIRLSAAALSILFMIYEDARKSKAGRRFE
jgi:hypothetical protein